MLKRSIISYDVKTLFLSILQQILKGVVLGYKKPQDSVVQCLFLKIALQLRCLPISFYPASTPFAFPTVTAQEVPEETRSKSTVTCPAPKALRTQLLFYVQDQLGLQVDISAYMLALLRLHRLQKTGF